VDAVCLNRGWNMNQIFVDHRHERCVVFGGELAEDLLKGLDVVAAVVGGQGDTSEQDLDVRVFKRGQHLVEVPAGFARG